MPEESSSLRLLIAEDSEINRVVALKLLNKMGYEADIACNGQEVLDMLSGKEYDLIFMDVLMPVIDGLEACRRIRSSNGESSTPVIVAMTANELPRIKKECREAGMDDYLDKPIQADKIQRIIKKYFPSEANMAS